jgi:hypothetical protein
MPASAVVAAGMLLPGCGGTLEGKYRRGQITTSTTGRVRAPDTSPTTGAPTTTTTTTPTAGNAAGQSTPGESNRFQPGGSIVMSAAWRIVVLPIGGRHR